MSSTALARRQPDPYQYDPEEFAAAVHDLDKRYPRSLIGLEMEAAVLGAVMIDNKILDTIIDVVEPEDFYEPLHARIYVQILVLADRGVNVSPVSLRPYFLEDETMIAVGGTAYLATMTESATVTLAARDFAAGVADLARRRRLIDEMRAAMIAAAGFEGSAEDLADQLDASLSTAMTRKSTTGSSTGGEAMDSAVAAIDAEQSGKVDKGVTFAGFPDLNDIGLRCRPGDFVVVGARPGMGKTAIAVKAAVAAAEHGDGVLFITLEVSRDQIGERILADQLYRRGQSASYHDIQRGKMTMMDREHLVGRREAAKNWPLHIVDPPTLKIGRLALLIRRYKRRLARKGQTLKLVIIDYLGLIRGDRGKSKYEETSEITQVLKATAKETGTCIMALAQLSRGVEQRDDKRPHLADLRDSGSIEQDADDVAFIYREQYYLERAEAPIGDDAKAQRDREAWEIRVEKARDRVEIYTEKVRAGRSGRRNCYFFMDHQAVRGSNFFRDEALADRYL